MFTNKKAYVTYSTLCFLTIMMLCLFTAPARAGFDVVDTEPTPPSEDGAYYGNAQNDTFRRAIESEDPLDVQDRAFLSSVHEERLDDRWYFKVRLARPSVKLEDIENRTSGSTLALTSSEEKKELFQLTPAFGYRWTRWALELEALISEGMPYRANPLFTTGTPVQLKTDVKLFALFGNVEYRIPNFFDLIPKKIYFYLTGGLGVGAKLLDSKVSTVTGTARASETNTNMDLVWNLGLGGRYQVTGNILLDLAYRLIDLGSATIGPVDDYTVHISNIRSTGFHFGVVYQL